MVEFLYLRGHSEDTKIRELVERKLWEKRAAIALLAMKKKDAIDGAVNLLGLSNY